MYAMEKTDNGHDIPKIFKDYSNCDPEGAKAAIDSLWKEIYEGAGVEREKFQLAVNRVYFDGYFGPIPQEDWDEEDQGAKGLTVTEALKIVEDGMNAVSDISYYNPEHDYEYDGDDEDYQPQDNSVIEAKDLKRSLFKFYYEIYGG